MTHYFIRHVEPHGLSGPWYEVTKYEPDHRYPSEHYLVSPKQGACDCASYRKPCKHVRMVHDWLNLGDISWYFDDSDQKWHQHPFIGRIERRL